MERVLYVLYYHSQIKKKKNLNPEKELWSRIIS